MTNPTVALYCPGDKPEKFQKAQSAEADFMILDLQDSVASRDKSFALESVMEFLATQKNTELEKIEVRVNGDPVEAKKLQRFSEYLSIRLPRVETAEQLDDWASFRRVTPLVETSLGMQNLEAIANHPKVCILAMGEADLLSELGANDLSITNYFRIRLITVSAAAGLERPMMSAWTKLSDSAGLEQDCLVGKSLGFTGRTAIHPKQIPVIKQAFSETESEKQKRMEIQAQLGNHGGVALDKNGDMIDTAHIRNRD